MGILKTLKTGVKFIGNVTINTFSAYSGGMVGQAAGFRLFSWVTPKLLKSEVTTHKKGIFSDRVEVTTTNRLTKETFVTSSKLTGKDRKAFRQSQKVNK